MSVRRLGGCAAELIETTLFHILACTQRALAHRRSGRGAAVIRQVRTDPEEGREAS